MHEREIGSAGVGLTPRTVSDFSTFQSKISQKFKIDFVVEISPLMWEERILPVLSELEAKKLTKKVQDGELGLNLYICKDLNDLPALRRLKDYPDETTAQELLEPWVGTCIEEKSSVVVNPMDRHSGESRNPEKMANV